MARELPAPRHVLQYIFSGLGMLNRTRPLRGIQMTATQPTGVGRLSIPALILVHILGIIVGATVLAILGAVVAAILRKSQDDTNLIIGLSFVVGAVLPSILLWRARRRSLRANLATHA